VSILERQLAELEARLGSVSDLELAAGFLGVMNASLLQENRRVPRAALVRLRARIESLATVVARINAAVEHQLRTLKAGAADVG
jgi:hypothetical protein